MWCMTATITAGGTTEPVSLKACPRLGETPCVFRKPIADGRFRPVRAGWCIWGFLWRGSAAKPLLTIWRSTGTKAGPRRFRMKTRLKRLERVSREFSGLSTNTVFVPQGLGSASSRHARTHGRRGKGRQTPVEARFRAEPNQQRACFSRLSSSRRGGELKPTDPDFDAEYQPVDYDFGP